MTADGNRAEADRARLRFGIISLVRLGGAALAAVALLSIARAIDWIPAGLDYALLVLGLLGTLVAPRLLARRWRSPDVDP